MKSQPDQVIGSRSVRPGHGGHGHSAVAWLHGPPPLHGMMREGLRALESVNAQGPGDRLRLLPTPTASPYGRNRSPSRGASIRPSLAALVVRL